MGGSNCEGCLRRSRCAVVVVVAMVLMLLQSPRVTCYRIESPDDLSDLFDRPDPDDQVVDKTENKLWKANWPLLINLVRALDSWQRNTDTRTDDSEPEERIPDHISSKRARQQVYGAMPPMRELCRMMGYGSCPH